jgi:putative flippase GtrA
MTAPASRADRGTVIVEFARYLLCSAAALGADAGLYALGMRYGLTYPVAACMGFLTGLAIAYTLSVRWAFRTRSVKDARAEFIVFAGVGVAGLLLTEALLWLQVSGLGVPAMTAKIVAAGFVFLFNFGARKALLFTRGGLVARSVA